MTHGQRVYKLNILYSIVFAFIIAFSISGFITFIISTKTNDLVILLVSLSILFIVTFVISFLYGTRKFRKRKKILKEEFPQEWEGYLNKNVAYYSTLNPEEKERFIKQVQVFLGETEIMGIDVDVDDELRVLVASSAIIPVFSFPDWEFDGLNEILIYPGNFNQDYDFKSKDTPILGLVTHTASTMILSKTALYYGFRNANDKQNVGLHEFIHNVDGKDGCIDGIPALLFDNKTSREWMEVMEEESENIKKGKSDINPYALTNHAEFFAVTSEYFFENPQSMAKNHPRLYQVMKKMFKQDTLTRFGSALKSVFRPYGKKLGRNSLCPCGSGKKYKYCCLKKKK
ncbi:MAG: zinc-dependent peptidase [Spirochaetales bacterium]|nr:zinc-dependent peptidase [Spirochaetales bacterium]